MPQVKKNPAPKRPSKPTDGRVLRGERNRQLIVDAVYDLVRSGVVQPTAQEVAQHAGVGTRTVFRQFEDMSTLAHSLGQRLRQEITHLLVPLVPTGRLDQDLAAMIERRANIFEQIAPFRRAGTIVRHRSPFLRDQDALLTRMQRQEIDRLIAPHLPAESNDILDALETLLSFEAWDRMRDRQKLSRKRAAQVLLTASLALTRDVI